LFIATIVAAERLTEQSLRSAAEAAVRVHEIASVEPDRVFDLSFDGDSVAAREALERLPADIFVQAAPRVVPRLFIADMDSTMITIECIDELADYAGVKRHVAEITERAMRGELDFEGALKERVALLKGLPEDVLRRCYEERVRLMPGATTLVRTLSARGVTTLLVSGGFTYFADRVAARIGFNRAFANRLAIEDGVLNGTVAEPILGADAKLRCLDKHSSGQLAETVAIGDGANDAPMLAAAGLGIAYHAKQPAIAAAKAAVRYGDLTTVLHALGIPRSEWVESEKSQA
jgi:phosphoserine phosphatase